MLLCIMEVMHVFPDCYCLLSLVYMLLIVTMLPCPPLLTASQPHRSSNLSHVQVSITQQANRRLVSHRVIFSCAFMNASSRLPTAALAERAWPWLAAT